MLKVKKLSHSTREWLDSAYIWFEWNCFKDDDDKNNGGSNSSNNVIKRTKGDITGEKNKL